MIERREWGQVRRWSTDLVSDSISQHCLLQRVDPHRCQWQGTGIVPTPGQCHRLSHHRHRTDSIITVLYCRKNHRRQTRLYTRDPYTIARLSWRYDDDHGISVQLDNADHWGNSGSQYRDWWFPFAKVRNPDSPAESGDQTGLPGHSMKSMEWQYSLYSDAPR